MRTIVSLAAVMMMAGSTLAGPEAEGRATPASFRPIEGVRSLAGRVIAKVRPGLEIGRAVEGRPLRIHAEVGEIVLAVPDGETELSFADRLMATGRFEYVEPDWLVTPAIVPNDPSYPLQWHLPRINMPSAWDLSTGEPTVTVAFCDSGVDLAHPDLAARLVSGYNSADRLSQADGGAVGPTNDHGTGVAGCIGAIGDNGVGVAGVGWNLSLMPIRVTNQTSGNAFLSDINEGARWAADHGAAIVNISYNGVGSAANRATARYLSDRGVSCVWAAGNSSTVASSVDIPDLFIVSATTQADGLASFSNFGPGIDIAAPGVGIWTTKVGGYLSIDGTSFSAPLTAGALGLLRSAHPGWRARESEYALTATAGDLGAPGRDDSFGAGIVNVRAALELAQRARVEAFAPVARRDRFVVFAGSETELDVLANDLDLNAEPIRIVEGDGLIAAGELATTRRPGERDTLRLKADAMARGVVSAAYTAEDPTGLRAGSFADIVVVAPLLTAEASFSDFASYSDFLSLKAADLDGDGDQDIIAGSTVGPHLFRNDGGELRTVRSITVFSGAERIDHADLNGDAIPDLVCAFAYGSSFGVGLSGSAWNYTFSSVPTNSITDLILRDESGRPLDFNRDGNTDLLTLSSATNALEVRLGDGAGGFGAPRAYTVGFGPAVVRAADLNRDGFTDVIVATSNFTIDVFLGRAGGEFSPRRTTNVGVIARDIRVLDADQTGGLEIAVLSDGFLSQVPGVLILRPTQIAGNYALWKTLSAGGEGAGSMMASDLNRDGLADIVVANSVSRNRSFHPGLGSEGPVLDPVTEGCELSKLNALISADLDGDGLLDLVLGGQRAGSPVPVGGVEVRLNRTPAPCAPDFNSDGFIDFADYIAFVDCFVDGGCPEAPTARTADFNRDAFVDFFDYFAFVDSFERGC